MELTMELARTAQCTTEEKLACYDLVVLMRRLAVKARINGILSIEKDVEDLSQGTLSGFLLKRGLTYVMDGMDPENIEDNLGTFFFSEMPTGSELLRCLIVMKAVLLFQKGMNPRVMSEMLLSFLGMGACKKLTERLEYETGRKAAEDYLESLGNASQHDFSKLEFLKSIETRGFQQLLLEFDDRTVARALNGEGKQISRLILSNVSSFRITNIMNEITLTNSVLESEVASAQKKIADKAHLLAQQGILVIQSDVI